MRSALTFAITLCVYVTVAAAAEKRPLTVDDLFHMRTVGEPRLSPDGAWVAYTVTAIDDDESNADIFMSPVGGGDEIQLTRSSESERSPRFSPDGRYLAFLSSRESDTTQVWLLDRRGGEARQLTEYEPGVSDLAWSPDSRRLALVITDPDPATEEDEADGPIVVRRLQFKRDGQGYLGEQRDHIHLFDVESRASSQLTDGPYDDKQPVWSPDSRLIAFVSNRTEEPDANDDSDVFVIDAVPGSEPRALSASPGTDHSPVFSPDGRQVAFVMGGDPALVWYAVQKLAVARVDGGSPIVLTGALDRNVMSPRFDADGSSLLFLLEDGGNGHLARVPVGGGDVERIVAGERDIGSFDSTGSTLVVRSSTPHRPAEIFRVDGGELAGITQINDEWLEQIELGPVERIRARSADGTMIDAFVTVPARREGDGPLPTLLRIHGGPVSQFSTSFSFEWQLLAAHGYAVVAANPRGSSGYGEEFSKAIWADWGNKDFQDVMAAVDRAIEMGIADPERLGVGGWSYGGILTNYVITQTTRFKAAISGASEVNYLSNYGTDHYQREWEAELGLPWRNTERWIEMSPWFKVDEIETPTLIMGGENDLNVPLLNSEQLYQALRRLGRETELVIYPNQNHGIRRPSYRKDRYERYLAWYDRYVKGEWPAEEVEDVEATSLLGEPLRPRALTAEAEEALEASLHEAMEDFARDPEDADHIIWLGRRLAYLSRYGEAIDVYTRGLRLHPEDARLYRHRGHRYISTRRLDEAIADFDRAARLIAGKPVETEPDGIPSARGVPTSTTQFNIYYHLGLAHYLKGDFERALDAYRECMKFSRDSDENLVATSDWLYMTLRRLGRDAEAAQVLEPIREDLDVIDNTSYLRRLLLYMGELEEDDLLRPAGELDHATLGYGVANWHLYNGREERARALFEKILRGSYWSAFGHIAAEADLARLR